MVAGMVAGCRGAHLVSALALSSATLFASMLAVRCDRRRGVPAPGRVLAAVRYGGSPSAPMPTRWPDFVDYWQLVSGASKACTATDWSRTDRRRCYLCSRSSPLTTTSRT